MEPLEPSSSASRRPTVDMKAEGVGAGDSRDRGDRRGRGRATTPRRRRRAEPARAALARDDRADPQDDRQPRPGEGEPGGVHRPGRATRSTRRSTTRPPRASSTRPTGDDRWSAELFKSAHQDETVAKPSSSSRCRRASPTRSSATRRSRCSSRKFLDARDDVPLFLKLPGVVQGPDAARQLQPRLGVRAQGRRRATTSTSCARPRAPTNREAPVGVRGLEDQVRQGPLRRAERRLRLPLGSCSRRRDRRCAGGSGNDDQPPRRCGSGCTSAETLGGVSPRRSCRTPLLAVAAQRSVGDR